MSTTPRCPSDQELRRRLYVDDEIDAALTKIDVALPKCLEDHKCDTEQLGE